MESRDFKSWDGKDVQYNIKFHKSVVTLLTTFQKKKRV